MAEIYVTSTADSGAGSLRKAIADAQDGDVILFDADVFPAGQTTSILLSSYITVNKSISIYGGFNDGNGGYTSGVTKRYYVYREVEGVRTKVVISSPDDAQEGEIVLFDNVCRVALDGQATQDPDATDEWTGWTGSRVMVIQQAGAGAVIKGLTLCNGVSESNGTGALLHGDAVIDNLFVTFFDCAFVSGVNTSGSAGGISCRGNWIYSLSDCNICDCKAKAAGGGVYVVITSSTTLDNCIISNCTANNAGGVYATGASVNTLNNCVITGCSATTNGGGIYSLSTSQNTLNHCIVSDCSASQGAVAYITTSLNGQFTLNDCTILNCTATQYGGCFVTSTSSRTATNNCLIEGCNAGSYGGCIYAAGTTQNTLNNCTISDCTASNGGCIYLTSSSQNSINDCIFDDCSATTNGGAIVVTSTSINNLASCILRDCHATCGGGIYSGGTNASTLNNCSFDGCSATIGGAMYLTTTNQTTITDCAVTNCSAETNGGAILTNAGTAIINDCTFDASSSVYVANANALTISGGITTIAAAILNGATVTIADGAALTITTSATIGAASFTSEGRGYLAIASGINTSAATFENVVLCAYGADVSSFAEVDGVLEWEAANPSTTVLIERADGDSWTTVTQTAGESLTLYLPPSDTVRLFDGDQFFTAQAPSQRTYYYIGGSEGSFTSAADWSLRRGGVAITEPPVVAGQRFIVGDISSGE